MRRRLRRRLRVLTRETQRLERLHELSRSVMVEEFRLEHLRNPQRFQEPEPTPAPMPEPMPMLTEEEIAELSRLEMPDPVEEISHLLGLPTPRL